ncbi:Gamma-interferon-inducible-lysosomal thiol reductase [Armadillidium vulgare]|nr:Gamma-interferon-inducible-lysosomal thiol reductase [Armadillidium vulgare]
MLLFTILGLITVGSFPFIQGQTADPVKVTVFYESLCPYSIEFFVDQLTPTYKELSEIMVVETNAYGHETEVARPSGDGYEFVCQHGSDECYGNKILACGQKYLTDHEVFLDFNFCVMGASYPPSSAVNCSELVKISPDVITGCANSTEGENLLHEVGVYQGQQDPAVEYVPWVIINDIYSRITDTEARSNLKSLVCRTYEGELPEECNTV